MRNLLIIAATCGALTLATAAEAHSRIDQRQYKQQQRIARGISSGRLTPHETVRLQREQARIARYETVNRKDGRRLNRSERARLEAMQDRASGRIYAQKHDGQRW